MKKKKFLTVLLLLLLILLSIPTRVRYEDGGSIGYKAPLYEVIQLHQLGGEDDANPYIEGLEIQILGVTVYRKTNQ